MEFYVKDNPNFPGGYGLVSLRELSATWKGGSIEIPFGEEQKIMTVVGITNLIGRPVVGVDVTKVVFDNTEGYIICGGNCGVRVLDERLVDDPQMLAMVQSFVPGFDPDWGLPRGHGYPFIWIEDVRDLPLEVREVVECSEEGA